MIPISLAERPDIPASAKLVYGAIQNHIRENITGWPSIKRLSNCTGLSRSSVLRSLETLEKENLLCIEKVAGRPSHYRQPTKNQSQNETCTGVKLIPHQSQNETTPVSKRNHHRYQNDTLIEEGEYKKEKKKEYTPVSGQNDPSKEVQETTETLFGDEKGVEVKNHNAPRKRLEPLWDAIAAAWHYPVIPASLRTLVGKCVSELKVFGATQEQVAIRAKRLLDMWPTSTPKALVIHWEMLKNEIKQNGQGDQLGRVRAEDGKYAGRAKIRSTEIRLAGGLPPDVRSAEQAG